MAMLYVLLILGAVTTLYPFLLMVSTGFTGPTDQNENRLVPAFWQDDAKLQEKVWNDKYSANDSLVGSIRAMPAASPEDLEPYERFLMNLPNEHWMAGYRTAATQVTGKLQMRYQAWLRTRFANVDELNRTYVEENAAFQTVPLPNEMLDRGSWQPERATRKWQDWLEFKATLPADYRIPVRAERMYQEHWRVQTQNEFVKVPAAVARGATKFEELRADPTAPDYTEFRTKILPERYRETTTEELWAKVSPRPLPVAAWDDQTIKKNEREFRNEFNTRNYRYVLDYIALNGRALWNTIFFCLLIIITQLLVNPIAAYALSRYPVKSTGKILIFLLATMAFPAEVAMIPSFLLLKNLGLLNTFAALVLPAAASGYMIYLLKGFFDSLPQELFESGQIDGAKEHTMMLKIAFPLSRPVLGYLALLAFMGAYSAFLYAFLVCQDRNMWTLMVFIYQLQNTAPKAVMMAALALAALPTLAVFLACQRVIMRGIVLPGER